jgi:hypothetical protein
MCVCPIDPHIRVGLLRCILDMQVQMLTLIYVYACPIDPHTCRLALMYTLYAGADAEVRELSQLALIYVYVCPIDTNIRVGMP